MPALLRPTDAEIHDLELRYDGPVPRQYLEPAHDITPYAIKRHRELAAHFRQYGAVSAAEWHEAEVRRLEQ